MDITEVTISFTFLDLWFYCLCPSSDSETYKGAGSQLRMTATLLYPIFRVPCDLLSAVNMARLLQCYRLIKKQMFMLRSYKLSLPVFIVNIMMLVVILILAIILKPNVDKTGSMFLKIFQLHLCVLKISVRLDYRLLSG